MELCATRPVHLVCVCDMSFFTFPTALAHHTIQFNYLERFKNGTNKFGNQTDLRFNGVDALTIGQFCLESHCQEGVFFSPESVCICVIKQNSIHWMSYKNLSIKNEFISCVIQNKCNKNNRRVIYSIVKKFNEKRNQIAINSFNCGKNRRIKIKANLKK